MWERDVRFSRGGRRSRRSRRGRRSRHGRHGRGRVRDPHSGRREPAEGERGSQGVNLIKLSLGTNRSLGLF